MTIVTFVSRKLLSMKRCFLLLLVLCFFKRLRFDTVTTNIPLAVVAAEYTCIEVILTDASSTAAIAASSRSHLPIWVSNLLSHLFLAASTFLTDVKCRVPFSTLILLIVLFLIFFTFVSTHVKEL